MTPAVSIDGRGRGRGSRLVPHAARGERGGADAGGARTRRPANSGLASESERPGPPVAAVPQDGVGCGWQVAPGDATNRGSQQRRGGRSRPLCRRERRLSCVQPRHIMATPACGCRVRRGLERFRVAPSAPGRLSGCATTARVRIPWVPTTSSLKPLRGRTGCPIISEDPCSLRVSRVNRALPHGRAACPGSGLLRHPTLFETRCRPSLTP